MRRKPYWYAFLAILGLTIGLFPANTSVQARPQAVTAYDLINAVNNLRASHGLPAYSINSILMSVAQAHSDYQASIGTVTHYGPGGTRPYQRALAAGYNVANAATNPPGFYAENIQGGPGLTVQSVVNAWMGDSDHQNTMLSPNLVDVGAGVSCSGDYCYFTFDAGLQSGAPVSYTPPAGSTPAVPGGAAVATVAVVFPNTPGPDGSIKHTVREGDTLSTISIAYHVSVDEIKRLNKLTSNMIYPGNVLVIHPSSGTPTPTVAPSSTPAPTYTPFIFWTVTSSPSPTATPIPSAPVMGGSGAIVVGAIVVAALVLAGVLTASGARKRIS